MRPDDDEPIRYRLTDLGMNADELRPFASARMARAADAWLTDWCTMVLPNWDANQEDELPLYPIRESAQEREAIAYARALYDDDDYEGRI